MKRIPIRRGEIYYADLDPIVGSEQGDTRPILVVQNNKGNKYSPTVVIAPITRKLKKAPLPTHVLIPQSSGLSFDSLALVEQIRTIDRSRFREYIGCIEDGIQIEIDKALAICVGIKIHQPVYDEMTELYLCTDCEADLKKGGCVVVKKGWHKDKAYCDFCKLRQGVMYSVYHGFMNICTKQRRGF
jgi:mRNA interferase MazF